MKLVAWWILFLALLPSVSFAQTPLRATLLSRIESNYAQKVFFSSDSPMVETLLVAAKYQNPGVSDDTWFGIKRELSLALSKIVTEQGGSVSGLIRTSLDSFSDAELDRLDKLLNDPIYEKFLRALSTPSAHEQYAQRMLVDAPKFGDVINDVLIRHGLKGGH